MQESSSNSSQRGGRGGIRETDTQQPAAGEAIFSAHSGEETRMTHSEGPGMLGRERQQWSLRCLELSNFAGQIPRNKRKFTLPN